MSASPKVSRIPKTAVERIQKLHLKVIERFRQVAPSAFETEVRPAACLFATEGKRPKLESEKSLRSRREDKDRRGGRGALLTDAKTLGIVAKVKQTTVAVACFRSALAHEETFFPTAFLLFALRHNRSNSTLSPSRVGRDCYSSAALAILPTLAKVDLQDWMKNEPAIIRDDNRESNRADSSSRQMRLVFALNLPCGPESKFQPYFRSVHSEESMYV